MHTDDNVRDEPLPSLFERLGEEPFHRLARAFYARAATDPIIGPMLPKNLDAAAERQALFMIQFFGGPTTYSDRRGHPRLRARHLPFRIDQRARDAWMGHMRAALAETGIEGPDLEEFAEYFERASTFFINTGTSQNG
jgi:hemoglobin